MNAEHAPQTKLMLLNHASVLLQHGSDYLLTDPWFQTPAFGAWLPNPPLAVHPAMVAALGPNLRVLISHGHDDHCDDAFIALFDPSTPFVSADYDAPSVKRRLAKRGMNAFTAAGREGVRSGPFTIKSYINRAVSLDDAIYTIETPDALVVHANDNWVRLPSDIEAAIRADVERCAHGRTLYMSQTNSASGFPLTYADLPREERRAILLRKVISMARTGMINTEAVGIARFLSYAGFASVFVEEHPEYFDDSIFPDADFLRAHVTDAPKNVEVLDLTPGDEFDFVSVRRGFLRAGMTADRIRTATARYYQAFGVLERTDSQLARTVAVTPEELNLKLTSFLEHFNTFVVDKVKRSGFEPTIIGKTLRIEVPDLDLHRSLQFGAGLTQASTFNKKIRVQSGVLSLVLDGRSWFENLYTGYNAEFARHPPDIYNRDIVMYMVMFSYYYRNRILAQA